MTGDDVSESENWAKGHPHDSCGYYRSYDRKWYSTSCSQSLFFICHEDNLVLVTENKTWEEALNHCRQMTTATHKYDLFSFAASSHFSYVRDRIYKATTREVWESIWRFILVLCFLFFFQNFVYILYCVSIRFGQACVFWEGSGCGPMERRWTNKRCCLTARANGNTVAPCPKMAQLTGPLVTAQKEETSSAIGKTVFKKKNMTLYSLWDCRV